MDPRGLRFNNPFDISGPPYYQGGSVVGAPGQRGFLSFPDMASGYASGVQRLSDLKETENENHTNCHI